ncbi:serine/threonine-protein kinase [Actinoplanes couchii]|uniref:Protein kinase domain-containing protein n=1 Tax=Actinoplanes couchii TaxID=403638 RepID=A0ABQ3XDV4_9ACTN|nr:serine/threonine-protein kinase [Actinoplanes couchii]GID56643.1 hypothetical protein Aco03nite_050470 [Actinoplanes couchii]
MPLLPGDPVTLGRYRVLSRLSQGGMGAVYLGVESGRHLRVAIKVIRPEFADDPEYRARFRSEARRAREVPSFCTAAVLDADPEHHTPYLVFEYIEGPPLSQVVRERGPLHGPALTGLAVGSATALAAIHGAGVIHRDLKPGNVLLTSGGIKVIDFGIARTTDLTSAHTRTNQMVGTVSYMAPERFESVAGADVTPAADIFAWGVLVAYAATGRTPFESDSPTATAMKILTQQPNLDGLDGPLRTVVEGALGKAPERRPTAQQVLDVLLKSPQLALPAASATGRAPAPAAQPAPRPALPRARPIRRLHAGAVAVVTAITGLGVAGYQLTAGPGGEPRGDTSPPPVVLPAYSPDPLPNKELYENAALDSGRTLRLRAVEAGKLLESGPDGALTLGDSGARISVDHAIQTTYSFGQIYLVLRLSDQRRDCLTGGAVPAWTACDLSRSQMIDRSGHQTFDIAIEDDDLLFFLTPTGAKSGVLPTYWLSSAKYGYVYWNAEPGRFAATKARDFPAVTSFTLQS